ncbi:MAG: 50S ribosomal protein L22 [Candidatus Omnitrophica bacterium]|nr:50S ribosomal protein L22 [Candidatus Omnitrophota bacterium]
MISRASARFIRISPRKTRLVADMVRGKSIDEANAVIENLEKRGRYYIGQVLKSAVANATVANPDISAGDLYISRIVIDGGPMFKRYRAASMGRAMMIRHRTSHILIELDRKKEVVKTPQVAEKPKTKYQRPKIKKEKKDHLLKAKKMAAAGKGK